MKIKRIIAMIAVFAMLLSSNLSGVAYATGNIQESECNEMLSPENVNMSCTLCGDITYLRCRNDQRLNHITTHKTGFLGLLGEECRVYWYRATVDNVCMTCDNIVNTEYGHYCLVRHSICDDESWCIGGTIA